MRHASVWDVDASVQAYPIELASCMSLVPKVCRSSVRVCPEDGCMSRKSVGIYRATQTRLGRTHSSVHEYDLSPTVHLDIQTIPRNTHRHPNLSRSRSWMKYVNRSYSIKTTAGSCRAFDPFVALGCPSRLEDAESLVRKLCQFS